jgi:hypothetical protein
MPELTKNEFMDLFWACVAQTTKYMEAYHKAETWHIETYGKRKYSNYDSFRKVRDRR